MLRLPILAWLIATATISLTVAPEAAFAAGENLSDLSLEDLLTQDVTSVAKKPQHVDEAPAAIFVITQDDIRRSGAKTLPDLFRMVPGMEVATLPSGGAAVSARGFNGVFSNKLLVMIDGREVYQSALSGVFWDQQLVPLQDIQRIEIVRGPGATLWGANAVNGVINVVTRHSADALGVGVSASVDSNGAGQVFGRLGERLGDAGALRLYVTAGSERDLETLNNQTLSDIHRSAQTGFRYDQDLSAADAVTVQGDLQVGKASVSAPASPFANYPPFYYGGDFSGANLLSRWVKTLGSDSGVAVEAYGDYWKRREFGIVAQADEFNLDLSGHTRLGDRNEIVAGAAYRHTDDREQATGLFNFAPSGRGLDWYSAYVQDDLKLVTNRLNLSVGVKIENNGYAAFEAEPSLRLIWRSPAGWSVWTAVSRAARTPSRFETALQVQDPLEPFVASPNLRPEILTAYELGWRAKLSNFLSLDLTAYRNEYDHLIIWTMSPAATAPYFNVNFDNGGAATGQGVEAAVEAHPLARWTLKLAASEMHLQVARGGLPVGFGVFNAGNSPNGQVSLRSLYDLTDKIDLDLWYRYVDGLNSGPVKPYSDLSIRLAWRPTPTYEFYLRGANLLSARRVEMINDGLPEPAAIVQRRVEVGFSARY